MVDSEVMDNLRRQLREHTEKKLSAVGGFGRSPDGMARVVLNGMGDLVGLKISAPDIPPELAERISAAITAAWRAAARSHASTELANGQALPEVAERMRELNELRFGPEPDDSRST
jgi:DNA-binding protein YbaB